MGGVSGGVWAAALLHHRSARPKFLSDRPLKELFSLGLPSEKAKDQSYIRDVPVGSRHLHRIHQRCSQRKLLGVSDSSLSLGDGFSALSTLTSGGVEI